MRATVAIIAAALASAGAASASCGGGQINPVTVASGNWNGLAWNLQAEDSGDGRYGITVFVVGTRRGRLSGHFYVGGKGTAINLAWTSSTAGTAPPFVAGVVTQAARTISVGLSNRPVRTVRTLPPRCLLQPGISFFIAVIPPGAHPTFVTARTAAGMVVGSWRR